MRRNSIKLNFKRAVKRAVSRKKENETEDLELDCGLYRLNISEANSERRATSPTVSPISYQLNTKVRDAMKLVQKLQNQCDDVQGSTTITSEQLEQLLGGFYALYAPETIEYAAEVDKNLQRSFLSHKNIIDKSVQSFLTQQYSSKDEEHEHVNAIRRNSIARRCFSTLVPGTSDQTDQTCVGDMLSILSLKDEETKAIKREVTKLSTWSFNVLEIERILPRSSLLVVGCGVMDTHHLTLHYRIHFNTLRNLLISIEEKYLANPYHNSMHAADVTQTLNYFLTLGGLGSSLDPASKFAALFAAMVHDVGHPARSNTFLSSQNDPLAVQYGYRSPLERMHCAMAFELLLPPSTNIMVNMISADITKIRSLVVDMVLATDTAMHAKYMGRFEKKLKNGLNLRNEEDKKVMLQIALHAADVNNPAKQFDIYEEWTRRIMEEFYNQGDAERLCGFPISIGYDRNNPIPSEKMQGGFIIGIVLPVYTALAKVPKVSLDQCLQQLEANLNHWQMCIAKAQGEEPPPPPVEVKPSADDTTTAPDAPKQVIG